MKSLDEKQADPVSIDEAEAIRKKVTLDVQNIQAQLGDKQRTHKNGQRLSSTEYWAWKREAQHVLNQKLDQLRSVKNWIKEQRREISPPGAHVNEALVFLSFTCGIIETLIVAGVAFSQDELVQIKAAKDFVVLAHAA